MLRRVALAHIHVFESRKRAFKEDDVLQENIIVRLICGGVQGSVVVSMSHDSSFSDYQAQEIPFTEIVKPDDPERFIHIPTTTINDTADLFTHSLEELGLEVSTGPVVDFRVRHYWLTEPTKNSAPLLAHIKPQFSHLDLAETEANRKRIADRRGEDKRAIYYEPTAFRPIETFADELASKNYENLSARVLRKPILLVD